MGFYATSELRRKGDPTPENRVWEIFCDAPKTRLENSRNPLKTSRGNAPSPTKTASGRAYWPSRDPLGIGGGINEYAHIGNNSINDADYLGAISIEQIENALEFLADPSNYESDWAGRAILLRWLTGGGDWNIQDDQAWTDYMKENEALRQQLQAQLKAHAASVSGSGSGNVNLKFHAEMENGEGVIGYQYLHGTSRGFTITGTYSSTEFDGGVNVGYDVRMQWNDRIDPNHQYASDTLKARIGRWVSLGQAKDYDITIGWKASPTLCMENGRLIYAQGYPWDEQRQKIGNPSNPAPPIQTPPGGIYLPPIDIVTPDPAPNPGIIIWDPGKPDGIGIGIIISFLYH